MYPGRIASIISATLAVILVCSMSAASAQDMGGRRASQFDLGIYGGGAYTTDWFAGAEGGGVVGTSRFQETPPFDVDFSGFAGGAYVGVRTLLSPTVFVGGRVGVLFTSADGSHEPFPGFRVSVEPTTIVYGDFELGTTFLANPGAPVPAVIGSAFIGPAWGSQEVTGQFVGTPFLFSDRQDMFGLTAGVRVEVPVFQNVALTGSARFIHFFQQDFSFPGTAKVESDDVILTGGARFSFWTGRR